MVLTRLPWSRLTSASDTASIAKAFQQMYSVKRVMPPKIGPVLTMGIGKLPIGMAPLWDAICRVFGCRAIVSKRQHKMNIVFVGSSEDITLSAIACRKIVGKIGDDSSSAESLHMHIRHTFSEVPAYLSTTDAIRCRIKAMGKTSGFAKPTWRGNEA